MPTNSGPHAVYAKNFFAVKLFDGLIPVLNTVDLLVFLESYLDVAEN